MTTYGLFIIIYIHLSSEPIQRKESKLVYCIGGSTTLKSVQIIIFWGWFWTFQWISQMNFFLNILQSQFSKTIFSCYFSGNMNTISIKSTKNFRITYPCSHDSSSFCGWANRTTMNHQCPLVYVVSQKVNFSALSLATRMTIKSF